MVVVCVCDITRDPQMTHTMPPKDPGAGIRRVVPVDAPSPVQGTHHSRRREISVSDRKHIKETSISGDAFFSAMFYDEDDELDKGSAASGESETDESYLAKRRDTENFLLRRSRDRRKDLERLRGYGAKAKDDAPPTKWMVRRSGVAQVNTHMDDIPDVKVRVVVMQSEAWCTVDAELSTLYAGARPIRGGLVGLVWRLASSGAYIGRRRPVVTLANAKGGESKEKFDDAKELLRWGRAGRFVSRHGQVTDVNTFSIDSRIDLGVSVASVCTASDELYVVGYAYWCLRNPISKFRERFAHVPPLPTMSKSLRAQLWELERIKGTDGNYTGHTISLTPGWQRVLHEAPTEKAHKMGSERGVVFRPPQGGI